MKTSEKIGAAAIAAALIWWFLRHKKGGFGTTWFGLGTTTDGGKKYVESPTEVKQIGTVNGIPVQDLPDKWYKGEAILMSHCAKFPEGYACTEEAYMVGEKPLRIMIQIDQRVRPQGLVQDENGKTWVYTYVVEYSPGKYGNLLIPNVGLWT